MFANLWNYGRQRNSREAIFFYLAHFVMGVMAAGVLSGIIGLATGKNHDADFGVKIGSVVAVIFSLTISFVIAYKKHGLNSFWSLVLIGLSGALAYVGGALLGLIPAAYLSLGQPKIAAPPLQTSRKAITV